MFGQLRHKKKHKRSYNSTTAKDSGGEQIKGLEFDNTIKTWQKIIIGEWKG